MSKGRISMALGILLLLFPIAFLGCSGGGSSSSSGNNSSTSPSIQVLPSAYDFGSVTPDNSPAPLEVEIINNGSAELIVSDIALSDLLNFDLDLSGGSDPCGTPILTIAEENSCTLEIAFTPQSFDSVSTTLNISSNDPNTPIFSVPISGSQEEVLELNVTINQVQTEGTCPGATITAYVSVLDQGGYPVAGLLAANFTITEGANPPIDPDPDDVSFVEEVDSSISVALVMDYSGSITDIQDAVDDMEESAASFIGQLGANDEGEIVKFDSEFEVVQDWTSDKDLLTAAIYAQWDKGRDTVLFDATWKAIDDTALRQKDRKAVIVITDALMDISIKDLDDVIDHANDNNVPIFTVGLGELDISILQQMADDTGGQFYEAITSDNLKTIYDQVAEVLFEDQYILTYVSGLGDGTTGDLTIQATSGAIEGQDTKEITPCPVP